MRCRPPGAGLMGLVCIGWVWGSHVFFSPGVYTPGYALSPTRGGLDGVGLHWLGLAGIGWLWGSHVFFSPGVYTPGYALSPTRGGLGLAGCGMLGMAGEVSVFVVGLVRSTSARTRSTPVPRCSPGVFRAAWTGLRASPWYLALRRRTAGRSPCRCRYPVRS
jgi:hypothetical protein